MLGQYRTSVFDKKMRAEKLFRPTRSIAALMEEVQRSTADSFLVGFDNSWWTIRGKIDAYLETAETQAVTMHEAVGVIDGYVSKCNADYATLNRANVRVMRARDSATFQLRDTWHAVEREIGLLSATIVDTDAFLQLGRLDAASTDVEANHSVICDGGSAAKEAAHVVLEKALEDGLASQTYHQLMSVFPEIHMLRSRFLEEGLEPPSDETWKQAVSRSSNSFQEFWAQRDAMAIEMAVRVCSHKQSALQTQDEKNAEAIEKELAQTQAELNSVLRVQTKNKHHTKLLVEDEYQTKILLAVCGTAIMGMLMFFHTNRK